MKKVGLIGGMSWESTAIYYRYLNEGIAEVMGGQHSAPCVVHSMDFAIFEKLSHEKNWRAIAHLLEEMATDLEKTGVEALVLCSNTAHLVADEVSQSIGIPLLHIADATGKAITDQKLDKIGLLGTSFTMEEGFYQQHLEDKTDYRVVIPPAADRELVHQIIYDELCKGILREESKDIYLRVISDLALNGCQGVILGCTEIGMLINQNDLDEKDISITALDTTRIHCDAILAFMTES